MAYQLSTVRTRVQNKLDDTNFSASKITQFINDAQNEIFNSYSFPFNEKTASATLTTGTNTFTLPTDFQAMKALGITAPDNYEIDLTRFYMNYNSFKTAYPDDDDSSGVPGYWTIFGDTVTFAWLADVNYTLSVDYLKNATELVNDSDVPEIPEAFGEILVTGAYIRALEHNDDNDIADYQRTRYYVPQLQNMLNRYSPRIYGKQPKMRNSRWGV